MGIILSKTNNEKEHNIIKSLRENKEETYNEKIYNKELINEEEIINKNEPNYEYTRYICNSDTLKKTLDIYGIAIIPNVLDDSECEKMYNGTWKFFEHITSKWQNEKIIKNDFRTWKNFFYLNPGLLMLHQRYNIGHSQHSWDLRQNPKIVSIFAQFWNCKNEDLLVSFDGLSFLPPPEITNKGWASEYWFHMDQRFSKPNFDGIQSWITAIDVNENDATLVFFEKSHLLINEFLKHNEISEGRMDNDWAPINKGELEFYKKRCQMKAIKCPAGSLVIWDSRLVHCGMGPKPGRKNINFRCINYLSYSPRETATEEILLEKQYGFENLYTSNHYANRASFFPTNPRNIYFKKIPPPKLTKLGLRLAGYNV